MAKPKLPIRFVDELVSEVAGSDVVPLVNLMLTKDCISEFDLADKIKISVNQIRNMLYRLQNHNLVDFIKKKDKKKGWYIYYWLFDLSLARKLIKEMKENKLVYLKKRLEHEKEETFYRCPNDCIRLNAINAMEHSFRCDECGELLIGEQASNSFEAIRKEIRQLEEDIAELNKEFVIKAREEKLKEAKERIKKRKVKKKKAKKQKKKTKKTKKIKKIKKKIKKLKKKQKKAISRKKKRAFFKKKSSGKKKAKKKIIKKKKKSRR